MIQHNLNIKLVDGLLTQDPAILDLNLILHKELENRGQKCLCIRCTEVRKKTESIHKAKLVVREIEEELSPSTRLNHHLDSIYKDHYRELEKYKSKNYFLSFESCECKTRINTASN